MKPFFLEETTPTSCGNFSILLPRQNNKLILISNILLIRDLILISELVNDGFVKIGQSITIKLLTCLI